MNRHLKSGVVLAVSGVCGACALAAAADAPASQSAILKGVGIDQKLGAEIPLEAYFRDSQGHAVPLRSFFDGRKPVILTLVYYECPMMCTVLLNDLVHTLRDMPLTVGKDFDVLSVSFNPAETPAIAAAKKSNYLKAYGRKSAWEGWHFLTGQPDSIEKVTQAVGFRYKFDSATNQFVHPSGIIILTPTGKVARYFFGVDYDEKDLRLSLVQASQQKIGTLTDTILLWCYCYDPGRGKYTLAVLNLMRAGGAVIVAAIAILIIVLLRRERRRRHTTEPTTPSGQGTEHPPS